MGQPRGQSREQRGPEKVESSTSWELGSGQQQDMEREGVWGSQLPCLTLFQSPVMPPLLCLPWCLSL